MENRDTSLNTVTGQPIAANLAAMPSHSTINTSPNKIQGQSFAANLAASTCHPTMSVAQGQGFLPLTALPSHSTMYGEPAQEILPASLAANRSSSPTHSTCSARSQAINYRNFHRRAELLHKHSEILREREALIKHQLELLDEINAISLADASDNETEPPSRPLHANTTNCATSNLNRPTNSRTQDKNAETAVIDSPHDNDASAPLVQSLLERIRSLEQQIRKETLTNSEGFPAQIGQVQTTPPNAHISNHASATTYHRRLTSAQIASRGSLGKELPRYDGKPTEWPLFYAAYNQSTELCGFSDDENLIRLRQALEGPARNAVKNLLLHSSCVPQIIATLQMRFGRPELIINVLQRQICELPQPSENRLETIIDFAIEVQNLCATMKASGLTNHLANPELEQKLVAKLPGLLPAYWGMQKGSLQNCNLQHFSDWLFQLAQGANCVLIPTESTKMRKRGDVHHHFNAVGCIVCQDNCTSLSNCSVFREMSRSQKWKIVRKFKLCHRCLKRHSTFHCTSSTKCGIHGCTHNHHSLLHNDKSVAAETHKIAKTNEPTATAVLTEIANVNSHSSDENNTLFRVLPVVLHAGDRSVPTFAFIDDGSSLTLIDEELLSKLSIKGTPQQLCLRWTGDTHRYEDESVVVDLAVSSKEDTKQFPLTGVRSVKKLDLPAQSIDAAKLQSQFEYLKGLPLASYTNATPQLLIGLNNAVLGSVIRARIGAAAEPIAEKCKLGWSVKGQAPSAAHASTHRIYHICDCSKTDELYEIVKSYICIDSLGVSANPSALISKDDDLAIEQLQQHTIRIGDRFQTSLLWKYPNMKLPDSLPMAKYRAQCLRKKMQRDHKLSQVLQAKITDYFAKGYIRRMTPEDNAAIGYWYLPVFAVTNPNKPGKVRLVWDAAAKVCGVSLNSMLLKGPDLTTPLLSVLFKFRQKRIAITADIAEMFHQVRIRPEDQNFLRFLWYEPHAADPVTYVMSVMTFGASCSPSCAQFIKNKNAAESREEFPRASLCIVENHYVDDMLDSVDTEEEATKLALEVQQIHAKGGFHLRNFRSNSSRVMTALNANTSEMQCLNLDSQVPTEKVLGMWWDTSTDHFIFRVSAKYRDSDLLTHQRRPTKREILSLVMTIYDPLGLIGFYVVYAKIILQDVWRAGCDWDEPIPDNQFAQWLRWLRLIPKIEEVKIFRTYMTTVFSGAPRMELHTFVDASETSYAAVCYLRFSDGNVVDCVLVGSKTRVAPLKMTSIPRLELKAALLGARLAKHIIEAHSISITASVYWSDSRTVLAWLKADHRRYKQFVAFRISEILELTDVNKWRWVPTAENVADDATKWNGDPDFSNNSRWLRGPSFLRLEFNEWPTPRKEELKDISEELRPQYVGVHRLSTQKHLVLPEVERFSTWRRLLRATATTVYCARHWLDIIRNEPKDSGIPSSEDFCKAEHILWRKAQFDGFADTIGSLLNGKAIEKSSDIFKLSPYLDDDGVLRIDGRVKIAGRQDQVLLPRKHYVTYLIINHFHVKYHHCNLETAINEIRQCFWIPKLRVAANQVRRTCQLCKNRNAKPRPPKMACLPAARTAKYCRPFSYVGIDYFGPLLVTVKRSTEKRYVVLFTCLTTRALHLEIAYSLTTDACILAVRNFMARRGMPLEIWSDNGTNLRGAERELKAALTLVDKDQLIKTFTSSSTKWNFIPAASPHMGGAWERLVRSVKDVLYRILPSSHPKDELLRAALMEVEMIVNSRPLTYIPIDHEQSEALTPNHFLLGNSSAVKPIAEPVTEGVLLRREWRISQQLADAFWRRWVTEYLPTITRRTKWFSEVKAIEIGDVVYIVDPNGPRNCWPKGKVVSVRQGPDGKVRSATVKTAAGVYERPAAKIAVLDLKSVVHPDGRDIPGGSVANSLAAPTPSKNTDSLASLA